MVKIYDGKEVPPDALLYFTTPSCKPCKAMAPILESLPETFLKVDCEQNEVLASAFTIYTVPALVRLRGGRPVESMFGGKTKEQILAWLEE